MIKADGSKLTEKMAKALEIMKDRFRKEAGMADKFLEVIKQRTPVGKMTFGERAEPSGATRNSWTIHMHRNDEGGVRWTINADGREDIVFFLEWGTKRHIIYPKGTTGVVSKGIASLNIKGVLAFEWAKKGGGTFFAKFVKHPGTKPLGIVRQTQREVNAEGKRISDEMHAKLRALGSSR